MASSCPVGFDVAGLRAQVLATYDRVARTPVAISTFTAARATDLWAACIAGALPEPELAELALASGLGDPQITERFDPFRDTTAEATVARDLHVQAVNFMARK